MLAKLQLSITIFLALAATPVLAQGMQAGSWQSISPSGSIGPEQDSLLPPEVLPLDPTSAGALSAGQAQARQSAMDGAANVPGLNQTQQNSSDMRKQAFEQLYGNQNTLPQSAVNSIWRAGQTPVQAQQPAASTPESMNARQAMLGAPNFQMAQNQQTQQGYIAHSQTLTGSSQNQPQQMNTRRAGTSNMLNFLGAAGMGLGSAFFMNNPWLGAGMFATTMTGFGVRNNSRF